MDDTIGKYYLLRAKFKTLLLRSDNMVSLSAVQSSIEERFSDAQVFVKDLTGGGDHLEAIVISPDFSGKTRVKQHQMVYAALKEEMATEAIHALALRTFTPETWQAAGQPS